MKRLWMFALFLILPLAAQEPKPSAAPAPLPEPNKPRVQKVFILKYADPNKVASLLGVLSAGVTANGDLHALAVTSAPEVMPAIEDAIKQLDVPGAGPQDIELTVYYLIGGGGDSTPGGPVPKDLDGVVTQLRNSFAFKTYHLLDALTLRTRSGQSAETNSNAGPVAQGLPPAMNQFRIQSATLTADGKTVRLDRMKAGIRMPVAYGIGPSQYSYNDLGLNADVDVKEGQKVVVGRLSVNNDQALFLVLTAHVVN